MKKAFGEIACSRCHTIPRFLQHKFDHQEKGRGEGGASARRWAEQEQESGEGRPKGSRREKGEAKVGSVGEEKREQIMQPGATVTALEVWERIRSRRRERRAEGGREAESRL
jgi:hypothetical protein